jgi:hypothetical protein
VLQRAPKLVSQAREDDDIFSHEDLAAKILEWYPDMDTAGTGKRLSLLSGPVSPNLKLFASLEDI